MNAPLQHAKIHAVSPDKQTNVWLALTNIQDEEHLWNILNYVYLYDFGSISNYCWVNMAQIVKSSSNITIKKISCKLKRKCKLAVFAWVCPLRSY